jgi:lipoprotein NlpI
VTPDYAGAFNNRGNVRNALGEYEQAIADFDTAIRLKPDFAAAYKNRSRSYFYSGQYSAAAADLQQNGELNAFEIVLLHVARVRGGQDDRDEFARNAGTVDLKVWPGGLVALFLGRTNAEQVMAAAASRDGGKPLGHRCQAAFFIGEKALLEGDVESAERLLREAGETCPPILLEYRGARAELTRMGK